MKLILIIRWCCAALQVAHVAVVLSDDQRPLELTSLLGIDAEVCRQLHRARDSLRDVAERPVAEHRGVQCREVVVSNGNHTAHVLLHQLGILLNCLGNRAEDNTRLRKLRPEGGSDGNRVEHCVDGHVRQTLLLIQRNAELVEGTEQLRIHIVQRVQLGLLLGLGVVHHILVVDCRVVVVGPVGLLHGEPFAVGLEAEVEHPFRLTLLR
mmetsp:Transcript_34275/g.74971  ORF Transcript_34275/g.74971 Transcript_34275/m.74971 type:complete len:209 (-) Transcript_34275:399-1025(-)